MASIEIKGRMKVKTLQKQFKEAFGCTLRIYNGKRFADSVATLASLRIKDAKVEKGAELKVVGHMKCGSFENKILELFGIKTQVADPNDEKLAPNDITLSKAGEL